jgi:hypothetical protein
MFLFSFSLILTVMTLSRYKLEKSETLPILSLGVSICQLVESISSLVLCLKDMILASPKIKMPTLPYDEVELTVFPNYGYLTMKMSIDSAEDIENYTLDGLLSYHDRPVT